MYLILNSNKFDSDKRTKYLLINPIYLIFNHANSFWTCFSEMAMPARYLYKRYRIITFLAFAFKVIKSVLVVSEETRKSLFRERLKIFFSFIIIQDIR